MITKTFTGWLVDIRPGGRHGRRVRRTFLTKEHAQVFERKTFLDNEQCSVDQGTSLPVVDLIDRYIEEKAQSLRGFAASDKYRLLMIRKFFESRNKPSNQVRLADGLIYENQRRIEGKAKWTIYREVGMIKRIFTWAVEMDLLPYSPFEKKWKRIEGRGRIRWLNDDESNRLLLAASRVSVRIYQTIFFALHTGFRKANVKEVLLTDIKEGFIWALKTKTDNPYQVPIDTPLQQFLTILKPSSGKLLDTSNLRSEFEEAVRLAGFSQSPKDPEKVTFHTLRHTFAAYWLQRGVPIYTVSKWLGHASVKMTEKIYGHLSRQHHINQMREAEQRGQNVDKQIIPFPQNTIESNGVEGIRTPDLCLDREEPCL